MADQARELIRLNRVSFQYPGGNQPSLQDIDLSVRAGEFLLISGPTGCGKSTLLKVISGIIPQESSGRLSGAVTVCGLNTCEAGLSDLARKVGLVFQSPDDQLCATTITDEVTFGPRNLGLIEPEVERRLKWSLKQVGLSGMEQAHTALLSGGQKQRVAIAAQLAMGPVALALDEPISQLDPQGAAEVLECLRTLSARGMAVILVEHRLGECLGLASRLLIMDQGRKRMGLPRQEVAGHLAVLDELGLKVPDELRVRQHWPVRNDTELAARMTGLAPNQKTKPSFGPALVSLDQVSFSYAEAKQPALRKCSLEIHQGEVLAVLGPNGSGKSTLLGILAGLYKPQSGRLLWQGKTVKKRLSAGKVGLLVQNPDLLLLETSLGRELMSGPKLLKLNISQERSRNLATEIDLAAFWDIPPWALSKGQRLRAALGAILATEPELLLLDEPTTGQNQANIHRLLSTLRGRDKLKCMVLCSHDLETVARFADRVAVLQAGRLADLGPTREVLSRMGQGKLDGLKPHWPLRISLELGIEPPFLTLEEVLEAHGPEHLEQIKPEETTCASTG